jgi:protein required for attachment to host cells
MTQYPRWIVAADSSKARLFVQTNAMSGLNEMPTMDFPEGRLHAGDMLTDQAGRAFSSVGNGHRSAMEPDVDVKTESARKFSRQVAGFIEAASQKGKFETLVIAAAPKFLGLLRGGLSNVVQRKVKIELPKDLVPLSTAEILDQVKKAQG